MSDSDDPNDWNSKTIEEFHANGGVVGGPFVGATLLLLHTIGTRSGESRVTPMMYQDLGEGRVRGVRLQGWDADEPRLVPQPRGQPGGRRRDRHRDPRRFALARRPAIDANRSGPNRSTTFPASPITKPAPIG